ncbi:MAG TPA: hypothetical protein VI454_13250 [Verrucomicrobiae bacterium]|jgi:hypothetical protein
MRNLHHYLENPFDAAGISLAELLAFSTDHLQRMIATDPVEFAARITATTSALTLVENCFTDDQTKLGLRKARKMVKDDFRKTLPDKVGKILAAVAAKYGPNAPEVVECCPQGRGVFSTCTDDQVANHLQTLVNGVTAHQADLGAPVVAEATALKAGWMAVYALSESSTAAKTTTQEGKKAARENLQLMLFLDLLAIAAKFPRQPEKLDLYMQQSLLEDHPLQPPVPPPGP